MKGATVANHVDTFFDITKNSIKLLLGWQTSENCRESKEALECLFMDVVGKT